MSVVVVLGIVDTQPTFVVRGLRSSTVPGTGRGGPSPTAS